MRASRRFFTALAVFLTVPQLLLAADYTIYSRNCTRKDAVWWDRSQTGTTGSSCGCPCGSAEWMGIDGTPHAPRSGNIYYRFTGTSGTYSILFVGKKDNECSTNYRITIGGKTVSGSVSAGSGEDRDTYTNFQITNNQEIKVWASSCFPSGVDHGSYNRWNRMEFTRTGTDPDPDPDPDPTDPPDPVTNLRATSTGATTVSLAWAASTGATSYTIYWTTVNESDPDATVTGTSYTITGLTADTEYSIWVKARNDDGYSSGRNLVVTTASGGTDPDPDPDPDPVDPPAKVVSLQAGDVTDTEIDLSWPAATGATSYNLYWTTVDVNNPDATVASTSYTIRDLTPATEYSIWIKSVNDAGMASGTNLTVTTTGGAVSARNPGTRATLDMGETALVFVYNTAIRVGYGDNVSLFALNGTRLLSTRIRSGNEVRVETLRSGAYVLRHTAVDGAVGVYGVVVE